MFDNFRICIEAVIPMFLTLAIGYLVRLSGIVTDDELNKFNKLTFRTLFPLLMFTNIYSSNIKEVVDIKLIIFTIAGVLAVYFAGTFFTLKVEKDHRSRGALIQAIYRSNFVIMGLPIATNIYGHSNVGVTAVMVAIIVPLFNILAVVTLETYRGSKVRIGTILRGLAKNPLILGAIAGILFSVFKIPLPHVIDETISTISGAATPVALIILGASFKFGSARRCRRNLLIAIIARLIAVPGVLLSIAALAGITDLAFVTLVSIFAAPCAISSFTMALEMESDADLAGTAVVFTSAFSCFTMFGWLFLFKSIGVF